MHNYGQFWNDKIVMHVSGGVCCALCNMQNYEPVKKGSMQEFGREGGAELWILVDKIAYKVFKGFAACRMMDRF